MVSSRVVHYGFHLGLDVLGHGGEGGGGGESGEQFGRERGGDLGLPVFLVDADAARQGDVHAHVFGEDLRSLLGIADFEDMTRVRERESLRGKCFLEVVGVEDAEAVLGHGGAEVFDGGRGSFLGFDDVTHDAVP